MHRARSAFTLALAPVGQQSFASWLLKGANKSRVTYLIFFLISQKKLNKRTCKVLYCIYNSQGRLFIFLFNFNSVIRSTNPMSYDWQWLAACKTNFLWFFSVIIIISHYVLLSLTFVYTFLALQRSTGCIVNKMLQFCSCRTIFGWYKFKLCRRNVQFMVTRSSLRTYG